MMVEEKVNHCKQDLFERILVEGCKDQQISKYIICMLLVEVCCGSHPRPHPKQVSIIR